jgi:hypothetical protein
MITARAILVLSLAAGTSAITPAVRPRAALKLRGGMGPIDASTAATVGAGLMAANGVYCGLAPTPAAQAYGLESPSFKVTQMIKSLGYTGVAIAILAIAMLKGMPLAAAFGWSNVPWILLSLDNIWNGTAEKMGQPKFAPLLLLAINSAACYCGLTDSYMPTAAAALAAWTAANGALFAVMPSKGLEAWGMKPETNFRSLYERRESEKEATTLNAMMKNFGYSLLASAVLTYSVASGNADIEAAVGYVFSVLLVNIVDMLLVSKTADSLTADKKPLYAWAVIQAGVVAATLA